MTEEQIKNYEENIINNDTPKVIKKNQDYSEILRTEKVKIGEKDDIKKNQTDKYIQLEDTINCQIYELFNNNNFIALLEKYDVTNEKETLKILNDELLNSEFQRENYEKLLEIKKNYNQLIQLFSELNCDETNKNTLVERIKQNDKKLLDSSLLNNQLISFDINGGIFKSNDYLKLLLLDLRILKKGVNLNNDVLLEREMITDMLNRNRVHFFTLRMNDLLKRHIEDVDILNKKDEDSFYLESVLRKKVNLIHMENMHLKEQINRNLFLINKKDQEISKLSFTLFSLQDQLDNSINNLRMRLKSKYGNSIHLQENMLINNFSDESIDQNTSLINRNFLNESNIKELTEDNQSLFVNKEIVNQNNNSNMHAHFRRHDYNITNNILKNNTKLHGINNEQNEVSNDSEISGVEKRFSELKSSIPSKLNILSQCKHIRSSISTPRESAEQINSGSLIITPVDTEHELVEKVESEIHHESSFEVQVNNKDFQDNHKILKEINELSNDIILITEEVAHDKESESNKDVIHKDILNEGLNISELDKNKKINTRQNLSLQNYKTTDKKITKTTVDHKNIQENEISNSKVLPKSDNSDLKNSRTTSKEHVKVINNQLGSFSKPTVTSLSKKRTKSKERLVDDYNNNNNTNNNQSFNNMYRSNSKTNLISLSHLKGGIFDESYVHNDSILSANILSKRNLRKTNIDLDNIVTKTKSTNLVRNSTININNKDNTVNKYLNDDNREFINNNKMNDQVNYATNAPIVRAYKATIQSIKSINDFQISDNREKDSSQIDNRHVIHDKKDSFLIYSPEIKPLELQPIQNTETNHLKSSDLSSIRSNSIPLINNTNNSTKTQQYPFNLLNTRSSSSYFNNFNPTLNTTNTFSNNNANIPSNTNTNNFQYIAPVPTPITIDTVQQKILFPNNFHALFN